MFSEDIEYCGNHIAQFHQNPFDNITKEEFEERIAQVSSRVGELNDTQIFVELNKVGAAIGDAHTTMDYFSGYFYPFWFEIFDGELYIINTDEANSDLLYAKVSHINEYPASYIMEELEILIPHENEYWVSRMMPQYL